MQVYGAPAEYLECTDREVLLEGGARTGKTNVAMLKARQTCELYPGTRILFTRETRVSMSSTVLPDFERFILGPNHPAITGTAKVENRTSYRWPNGSEILVIGMDDAGKILSGQFDRICWFQAERGDPGTWRVLLTRLSERNTPYNQMTADVNPAELHNWANVRGDQWICKGCGDVTIDAGETCPQCSTPYSKIMRRIRTQHTDNPLLYARFYCRDCHSNDARNAGTCHRCESPNLGAWTAFGADYMDGLRQLTGADRQRYLLHQWCSAEGLIFPEYSASKHHAHLSLDEPLDHHRRVERDGRWELDFDDYFVTWDWGYNDPSCMDVWGVIGNRLYRVWEWYKREHQSDEICEAIYEVDAELAERGKSLDSIVMSHEKKELVDKINDRLVDGSRYMDAVAMITPWTGKDVGVDCVKRYLAPREDVHPRLYYCYSPHRWGIDKTLRDRGKPTSTEEEMVAFTWIDPEKRHIDQDKPDPNCADHGMDNTQWATLFHEHVGADEWVPPMELPDLGADVLGLREELESWT